MANAELSPEEKAFMHDIGVNKLRRDAMALYEKGGRAREGSFHIFKNFNADSSFREYERNVDNLAGLLGDSFGGIDSKVAATRAFAEIRNINVSSPDKVYLAVSQDLTDMERMLAVIEASGGGYNDGSITNNIYKGVSFEGNALVDISRANYLATNASNDSYEDTWYGSTFKWIKDNGEELGRYGGALGWGVYAGTALTADPLIRAGYAARDSSTSASHRSSGQLDIGIELASAAFPFLKGSAKFGKMMRSGYKAYRTEQAIFRGASYADDVYSAGKMSRRSGIDIIDYDGFGSTASFNETDLLTEIYQNKVSMRSYQQMNDHGVDVIFKYDSGIDDLAAYYPNSRTIELYPANIEAAALKLGHDPANYAARVFSHEAKHVRRDALGVLTDTRYDEYLANTREYLFQYGRRPTLSKRAEIWQNVSNEYSHLDVGKRPVGWWKSFE